MRIAKKLVKNVFICYAALQVASGLYFVGDRAAHALANRNPK